MGRKLSLGLSPEAKRSSVVGVSSALGVTLDAGIADELTTWLDLLVAWNATHDLTAARSPEELLDLMLADAMALSTRLPSGARVVDVGSGAGAPGLPLALLRPDLKMTLVEPLAKRTSFLTTCLGRLQRPDVELIRTKAEPLLGGPRWDVAISRATLAPPAWLELGAELVTPEGSVWVLLAREEVPGHPRLVPEEELTYPWPSTGQSRHAVRFARRSPTQE